MSDFSTVFFPEDGHRRTESARIVQKRDGKIPDRHQHKEAVQRKVSEQGVPKLSKSNGHTGCKSNTERSSFRETYEYHAPAFYQEPAMWATFLKTRMDLVQAKAWFSDTYKDVYSHEVERHLHQRLVQSVCLSLDAAYAQPSIIMNKAWQESQRLVIISLVLQAEKYFGASELELAALDQAFNEQSQAPYIREAFTRAAEHITAVHEQPNAKHLLGFHGGRDKGRRETQLRFRRARQNTPNSVWDGQGPKEDGISHTPETKGTRNRRPEKETSGFYNIKNNVPDCDVAPEQDVVVEVEVVPDCVEAPKQDVVDEDVPDSVEAPKQDVV
eukprot:PhM_4_TR1308/c3_g3_i7/m.105492